jgi:hypothetical protein
MPPQPKDVERKIIEQLRNNKFVLYADAANSRKTNSRQLRLFASLLCVGKAMRNDLRFVAEKHLATLSRVVTNLPDPTGKLSVETELTTFQLQSIEVLRWYVRAELQMEKLVKQLLIETIGQENTQALTPVRKWNLYTRLLLEKGI